MPLPDRRHGVTPERLLAKPGYRVDRAHGPLGTDARPAYGPCSDNAVSHMSGLIVCRRRRHGAKDFLTTVMRQSWRACPGDPDRKARSPRRTGQAKRKRIVPDVAAGCEAT